MADIGGHLSAKGAFIDTNNDGIVDGFAHTIKNAGNFNTFSLTNGVLTVQGPTGGAAIGGSSTHIQYNQGGVFKGESNFTYNETSNTLTVDNITVTGTLTVTTTTTLNSNTVTIGDSIIVLNSDETSAPSQNAGIEIERGTSSNVQLVWDETNDQWDFDTYSLGSVGKVYGAGAGAVYTFTSDTNTGIEHTGADQLGLLTGNTRVLMVNMNGVHIAPSGATGAGSNQALLVDDIVMDSQTISTLDSNKNLILAPHGSGSVELGAVSSNATSVTTTPSAHNVVGTSVTIGAGATTAGTTDNIAGGSLTLAAGQGKGTGAGGSILFKTADGGSSGSTSNPLTTKMTILDSGFVGIAQNTPTVPLHVGGDAIISGNLTVSGTSTTITTTNTFVTDEVLTLNSGETANGVSGGVAGFEVDRGVDGGGSDNTIARFVFDESDDKFKTQMETGSGSGSYGAAGIVASSVEGTTGTFSGDLTVDTNVLKVDTGNNRVGVNKTPSVALDVSGEVAGDGGATFGAIVQGSGILAADKKGLLVYFINNNASATAIGMPLRIDGSHATSVVQANQAQSNTLANCAVGLATGNTNNGVTGRMAVAGSLTTIPASSFTGSDPADGDAVYVSGTVAKLTVDAPTTGYVQQIGRIQDTNVSVSGNSGTATIIISIGTPIPADVYDDDDEGVTGVTGTLPIVSSGGATPAISINAATTSAAGSMSAADKTKLDGIETSADVTDATNVNAAGAIMHSDVSTKGDLIVGDGAGDATILGVGTNNHVLTADSSEASGVKWAAAAGGGGGTIGIANGEYLGANANVADNDFLRVDGTLVEGRTAAQTLSDIGGMGVVGGTFTGTVAVDSPAMFKAGRAMVEDVVISGATLTGAITELRAAQAGMILLATTATVGLPDPGATQIGDTYVVINVTGGNVTIDRSGLASSSGHGVPCTLNGAASNGTLPNNEAVTLICTASSGGGIGDIWHGIGL